VDNAPLARAVPNVGPLSAGRVRLYLAHVATGGATASDDAVWSALAPRGALAGSSGRPEITQVGRQVLRELELRAYRADSLPLDRAAEEVGSTLTSLATMADTAEYFLAELGPVPPVEVVPLIRIVAAHLAVRHESPEDLVAEFANGWGGAEVLGGTPADRLLAAELLTGSGVPQGEIYSTMMTTGERLRDAGCASPVATAAILHLFPSATTTPPLDRWSRAREKVANDEGAAILAGLPEVDATLERWAANVEALEGDGVVDAERAGIYLTAIRPALDPVLVERSRDAARLFEGSFSYPLLAGVVAVAHLGLSPEESVDWHAKSVGQATAHQLAPTPAQLAVLGLALLQGLDPASFAGREPPTPSQVSPAAEGLLARTALHAWMYRELVRPPAAAR
jgi:hypothetical protein